MTIVEVTFRYFPVTISNFSRVKSTLKESYFSDTLKWTILVGSLVASGYLIFKTGYAWIVIVLAVFTLIMFTTQSIVEIDPIEKRIADSFQVLWIKTQSTEIRFKTLSGIRLDKERHSYTANSRARTAQTDFFEYIATLEYDDQSLELTRHVSYESFGAEMKRIAGELQIPLHRTF